MTSNTRLSILKPGRPREPLQDLSQLIPNNEEEETTTTDNHKRRVSFAAVNKVKEFETGAECTTLHQTPAYDERFSISSDSYQSSISEYSHNKSTFLTSTDASVSITRNKVNDENIDIVEVIHNMSKAAPSPGKMSAGDSSMDITSVIVRHEHEYTGYDTDSESFYPLNLTKSRQSTLFTANDDKDILETSSMETTEALPCLMTETMMTGFESFNQTMDVSVEELGVEEENDYRPSMNTTAGPDKIFHRRKSTILVSEKDIRFTVDAFGEVKDTRVQENIFVKKQVSLPTVESSAMEEDTSLNFSNRIVDKETVLAMSESTGIDKSNFHPERTDIVEREIDISLSKSYVPAKETFCFVSDVFEEVTEKDIQFTTGAIESQEKDDSRSENINREDENIEPVESVITVEQNLHLTRNIDKEESVLLAKNMTMETEKSDSLVVNISEVEKHSQIDSIIIDDDEQLPSAEIPVAEKSAQLLPIRSPAAKENQPLQSVQTPIKKDEQQIQPAQTPVATENRKSLLVQIPVRKDEQQIQPVQTPVATENRKSLLVQIPVRKDEQQIQPAQSPVALEKEKSLLDQTTVKEDDQQIQSVQTPVVADNEKSLLVQTPVKKDERLEPVQSRIVEKDQSQVQTPVKEPVAQLEPIQSPIANENDQVQPIRTPVKEDEQLQPIQIPILLEPAENLIAEESNLLHDEILTVELQNCQLIEHSRTDENLYHNESEPTEEGSIVNATTVEDKTLPSPKNIIPEQKPVADTLVAENDVLEEEISRHETSVVEMESSHVAENFDKNEDIIVEVPEKCSENVESSRPLKRKSDSFVPEIPPPEPSPKRPNTEINLEIVRENEIIRNQIENAIKSKEIPCWTVISLNDTEWRFGALWNRLHLIITLSEHDMQCVSKLRFIKKNSGIGDEILKVAIAPIIRKYRKKMDELCGKVEDVTIFMKMTLSSINFAQRFAEDFSQIVESESISLDNGFASFFVANYKSHLLAKVQVDMRNIEDFSDSSLEVVQNIGRLDETLVRRIFFEARGDYDFFSKFVNNLNLELNS